LRIAGATEPIFTERAIKEIYRRSGGIPRLINILCDNALLNGFALDQKVVDEKSIREVSTDLHFNPKPRSISSWILLSIGVLIITIALIFLFQTGILTSLYQEFSTGINKIKEIFLHLTFYT